MRLFDLDCRPPWLIACFPTRQRMVSWSLNRPGFVEAETVAWLQVSDNDLPPGIDPLKVMKGRLAAEGLDDAVGLMTARDIRCHHDAVACAGGITAEVVVTLGLTNGINLDSIARGEVSPRVSPIGTINILVAVSRPLSHAAMLETLTICAMARTAALLSEGNQIVGTGTDCIVVACPDGTTGDAFAGLHTVVGAQVTEAAYAATLEARRLWNAETATLSESRIQK